MTPLATEHRDRLDQLGEVGLLQRVSVWLGPAAPPPPAGPGDDAAVLPAGAPAFNIVTVDSVVRGRHFDDTLSPERVGAKLVKRNLSDLAAMGARPGGAVLALLLPPGASVAWLERFYRGLGACAHTYGLAIQGGDVAGSGTDWAASLTVWGLAERPLLRTGAQGGDSIWVTGELGGTLVDHHWAFTPRLAEGAWLAARPEVHSLMDLTDGFAKDLPALLGTDQVALLDPTAVPLRNTVAAAAQASGRTPLWHAANDGEDYELIFTLAANSDATAFQAAWQAAHPLVRLSCLGTVAAAPTGEAASANRLRDRSTGHPLPLGHGYAHFSS